MSPSTSVTHQLAQLPFRKWDSVMHRDSAPSVMLAPTCSREWEGPYVHKCCDKQSRTLERDRITQNRRIYTQKAYKTRSPENREPFHLFLYSKRQKASCPSSTVAKNVNQTYIPYLRSSLCKIIPTETGDRVKTDKEAGGQMALRDTGGNVQTAIRSATAWRQQGSLPRYKLQNPAFTWFSHICSQMSATGGQHCLGDSAKRCASPAQTLSMCGCSSVCVRNVLLGAPRWECLTLLALRGCWEKWPHTFHHGQCSSPQCL